MKKMYIVFLKCTCASQVEKGSSITGNNEMLKKVGNVNFVCK